ncbi:adenylate kinase, chloroplastic-like [Solanum pennellii]|uniref:adenylate kinase n=1 Tax=Solanum pennellii TaxID=28526 RepID=A0ABM1H1R5_SOLPN|nr:adenylate kinase, chloroplastic-like [Solanum pennellii]
MASCCSLSFSTVSSKPNKPYSSPISSSLQLPFTSQLPFSKKYSLYSNHTLLQTQCRKTKSPDCPSFLVVGSAKKQEPLRVMISGAPASGKGTQCELITKKYDLVHIAAGDLLRAEIAAGTENGRRAKEYMDKGQLVPNEIVVTMVKERLMRPDSQEKGWLLDGYPRSLSQAVALKEFQPDLFILLEVPEEILVERVVGRRLDPVTGRIYHLKYSPPETDEIAARLTQRFDDTEEKVKLRLLTHRQNVESVLSMYKDTIFQVDGSVSKEEVFAQIDGALTQLLEAKE